MHARHFTLLTALTALALAQTAHGQISLPVGYWSFDRCDTINSVPYAMDDSSAVRYPAAGHTDGRMRAGANCSSGVYGSGAYFDGVDDRITVEDNVRFTFTTAMTVAAWAYPTRTDGTRYLLRKSGAGGDAYMLSLQNGAYVFTIRTTNGAYVSASAPATANAWTHVAGVVGTDTTGWFVSLHLNGVQQHRVYTTGQIALSTSPVVIGTTFQGWLDEVKLYNQKLTPTHISKISTPPSPLGLRGMHLTAEPWFSPWSPSAEFTTDFHRIQYITNLNSLKTTIASFGGNTTQLGYQDEKLTRYKAAAGNHVTWVFRAWPMTADKQAGWVDLDPNNPDYFNQGRAFAQRLAQTFYHIKYTLKLQHVYIEVANEPNHRNEGFTLNNFPNPARYNEFFRGFYYGERDVGYDFPLVYAGLSPGPDNYTDGIYSSDSWYSDPWTAYHINNFAAKVGAHSYWEGDLGANNRTSASGGWYYRHVRNLLANAGVTPRGIMVTEFNGRRLTFSGTQSTAQANSFCQWWREAAQAAAQGYWTEQTFIWVSNHVNRNTAEDIDIMNQYVLLGSQIDAIRTCQ